ncbi:HUS1 checkpoint protein [Cryptococcus wingfieldii CBS 7118]|uniref:Checkpoint protein n=1 Tax=Cryptococcus wingfieldii CBS 7118 TaxID=1295528 RepID=A0A1E3HY97_9TREE|nr:HUS1 checkpoint protein [Cryptococcus wingfieldii CBS 7118]ODN81310.1 HUS1 checkpoint protein [Cryptococcus wingfieldii CBS 7118]
MRFRTAIANVSLLTKIIRALSALAKTCVIQLSQEQLRFIVPGHESATGVQVWSQVKTGTLFEGYRIESNMNNEIWVEVNLDALHRVLKSADTAVGDGKSEAFLSDAEVTLKLGKNNSQPIWSFGVRGYTATRKQMCITHEINVKILSARRQQELEEPLCPQPDIHVILPNLLDLRNVVARMGHLGDDMEVSANHEGKLELSVKGGAVNLATTWKELRLPSVNGESSFSEVTPPPAPPDSQMFSTTVTVKGLLRFLTSHCISQDAIMCICENHCVITYVYIGPIEDAEGVLTFYIPGKDKGN